MEEIVIFGHPSLRTKSSEITEFNNELEKLSERMIKIMYEAPGVGLAAPQIYFYLYLFEGQLNQPLEQHT